MYYGGFIGPLIPVNYRKEGIPHNYDIEITRVGVETNGWALVVEGKTGGGSRFCHRLGTDTIGL